MIPSQLWSPEREGLLVQCIEKKMSAAQTGEFLGISKNACCGKAKRMGLRFKSMPPKKGKKPKKTSKPKRERRIEITQKFPYREVPTIEPEKELEPLMITFGQLNDSPIISQCRFPYGDDPVTMTYCGHPVANDDCSWCHNHKRLMYQR